MAVLPTTPKSTNWFGETTGKSREHPPTIQASGFGVHARDRQYQKAQVVLPKVCDRDQLSDAYSSRDDHTHGIPRICFE
jgi:hypothetical protein